MTALPLNSSYKHIQALNASGDLILQNYELMDLITYCDDAIGADNVSAIRSTFNAA